MTTKTAETDYFDSENRSYAKDSATLDSVRILLLGDGTSMEGMMSILQRARLPCTVSRARTEADALERIESNRFNVLAVDIENLTEPWRTVGHLHARLAGMTRAGTVVVVLADASCQRGSAIDPAETDTSDRHAPPPSTPTSPPDSGPYPIGSSTPETDNAGGPRRIGRIVIDRARLSVTVDGRPVDLTFQLWNLLIRMVDEVGRPVAHLELCRAAHILPDPERTNLRDVVRRLRQRLGPGGAMIQAERGVGYGLFPRAVS